MIISESSADWNSDAPSLLCLSLFIAPSSTQFSRSVTGQGLVEELDSAGAVCVCVWYQWGQPSQWLWVHGRAITGSMTVLLSKWVTPCSFLCSVAGVGNSYSKQDIFKFVPFSLLSHGPPSRDMVMVRDALARKYRPSVADTHLIGDGDEFYLKRP